MSTMEQNTKEKKVETCLIGTHRGEYKIIKTVDISETILARLYKGYSTYGISAVIEYEQRDKDNSSS